MKLLPTRPEDAALGKIEQFLFPGHVHDRSLGSASPLVIGRVWPEDHQHDSDGRDPHSELPVAFKGTKAVERLLHRQRPKEREYQKEASARSPATARPADALGPVAATIEEGPTLGSAVQLRLCSSPFPESLCGLDRSQDSAGPWP
jgi:hypothetical protein